MSPEGAYEVRVERTAGKALARRIRPEYVERIRQAIDSLAQDPRPRTSRKLRGKEGRRLRVGDYRVLYEIEEPHPDHPKPGEGEPAGLVTILAVGHRQGIYG